MNEPITREKAAQISELLITASTKPPVPTGEVTVLSPTSGWMQWDMTVALADAAAIVRDLDKRTRIEPEEQEQHAKFVPVDDDDDWLHDWNNPASRHHY